MRSLDRIYQALECLEPKVRFLQRVKTLRSIRDRLAALSVAHGYLLDDRTSSDYPGCRLRITLPGEREEEEICVSIVAWDDSFFADLNEDDDWLEVAVVVGGHVREPVRMDLQEATEWVETFVIAACRCCGV